MVLALVAFLWGHMLLWGGLLPTPFLSSLRNTVPLVILLQVGNKFSLLLAPGCLTLTLRFLTSAHTSANSPFLKVCSVVP